MRNGTILVSPLASTELTLDSSQWSYLVMYIVNFHKQNSDWPSDTRLYGLLTKYCSSSCLLILHAKKAMIEYVWLCVYSILLFLDERMTGDSGEGKIARSSCCHFCSRHLDLSFFSSFSQFPRALPSAPVINTSAKFD